MTEQDKSIPGKGVALFLGLAFLASFLVKLVNIKVGAPFVTIDDDTTFQGGFLVWFGNAPPQRMYLESWLCGLTSLATYVVKSLLGQTSAGLGSNLVADAYQDYYRAPDTYVHVYRMFVLGLDMITAWMVYRLGTLTLGRLWGGWAAALAAGMYLFTFNTVWCDVVARPDALVAVFSTAGLFFYYRSEFGDRRDSFWLAAVLLGTAAGLKLHACLFVVFIVLDLWRVWGWRRALSLAVPLTLIAVTCFALASGMTLFDPLRYVKLRLLNVKDDESPWIQWGEQFYAMVRGSGWLVVPVLLLGAWRELGPGRWRRRDSMASVFFLAVCWLLLFASIRQLRAYWMLPALPLFYIAFLAAVGRLRNLRLRWVLVGLVGAVMVGQTTWEAYRFQAFDYNSLRTWIARNIDPQEPFFIYGYEAVELPKNNACLERKRVGILRGLEQDRLSGDSHVLRHLKNWEEESTLALFDLLQGRQDEGFTYYSVFGTPLDKFAGIIGLDEMGHIFVQRGFDPVAHGLPVGYLEENFEKVAELTGPGGGGSGLGYQVYRRRAAP